MKRKEKKIIQNSVKHANFHGRHYIWFSNCFKVFWVFTAALLELDRTLDPILTVCQVRGIHFVINTLFILSDWLGYASFGHIACLNIWNTNFSPEVLKALSLGKNKGNVYNLNMTSGTLHGDVSRTTYNESGLQRIMLSWRIFKPAWYHSFFRFFRNCNTFI